MNWDSYFMLICDAVAEKSPCLSRKIGAILVRDHSIISTGYNGPPRGYRHCSHSYPMYMIDSSLLNEEDLSNIKPGRLIQLNENCPRKVLGFKSGEALHLCPAQHAEENCISNAARIGASTIGSTLYLNTCLPCKNCLGTLINAGITEIVCRDKSNYDALSKFILETSNITIKEITV